MAAAGDRRYVTSMRNSRSAPARRAAIALAIVLALPLAAQGYSYDLTTTVTRADRATGKDTTVTFLRAHGQFASGVSRLDFSESMNRASMMGAGNFMISNSAARTVTFVDPSKRQYMQLDLAELSRDASNAMKAAPSMVSMKVTDVHVSMEPLGAGEKIEGYSTLKYRLTESYTMDLTMMGNETKTPTHTTSDIWIAPALNALMNPSARPDVGKIAEATGPMAPLTSAIIKAYANVKPGVMMKRVSTSVSTQSGKTHTSTTTTLISNVKKGPIPASVFEVPAGYTKVDRGAPTRPPPPK